MRADGSKPFEEPPRRVLDSVGKYTLVRRIIDGDEFHDWKRTPQSGREFSGGRRRQLFKLMDQTCFGEAMVSRVNGNVVRVGELQIIKTRGGGYNRHSYPRHNGILNVSGMRNTRDNALEWILWTITTGLNADRIKLKRLESA
jgi:hypothetical protein